MDLEVVMGISEEGGDGCKVEQGKGKEKRGVKGFPSRPVGVEGAACEAVEDVLEGLVDERKEWVVFWKIRSEYGGTRVGSGSARGAKP